MYYASHVFVRQGMDGEGVSMGIPRHSLKAFKGHESRLQGISELRKIDALQCGSRHRHQEYDCASARFH